MNEEERFTSRRKSARRVSGGPSPADLEAFALSHAVEACGEMAALVRLGRADFDGDFRNRRAAAYLLIQLGESLSRVGEATLDMAPAIPRDKIRGMRNRLTHRYDDINYDIVWVVMERELPAIADALEALRAHRQQ